MHYFTKFLKQPCLAVITDYLFINKETKVQRHILSKIRQLVIEDKVWLKPITIALENMDTFYLMCIHITSSITVILKIEV
jgi:hypothetical protein